MSGRIHIVFHLNFAILKILLRIKINREEILFVPLHVLIALNQDASKRVLQREPK